MLIDINEFKNGLTIELDGEVFVITEYEHVKPGKGSAFVRTKLKNLRTGAILERTFRTGEKIEEAFIDEKKLQFMYRDGEVFEFMDQDTYEQMALRQEQLSNSSDFLKENLEVTALIYKDRIITIELPMFVDLRVARTEPGIRGDTQKSGSKPAILETGVTIQVPLFIDNGDVVRVDTRTKKYVARA